MHFINIEDVLRECGCIHGGEQFYALTSGRVSTSYVNTKPLFSFPNYLRAVANMLMRESRDFSVVTGPATASIALIQACAGAIAHNFQNNELRAVYVNKDATEYTPDKRAYEEAIRGKSVIIVEDISSTGSSAKTMAKNIVALGGTVAGFRFIWNRTPSLINEKTMGAPVFSLYDREVPSFVPEEHPHWGEWPLVMDLGDPKHFEDYPGPRVTVL